MYDYQQISSEYRVQVKNRFAILSEMDEKEEEPNELWEEIRDIIKENARKYIPKKKRERKTKWLSEDTIAIAKDRRRAKAKGDWEEVKKLNGKFQHQARRDK